MILAADPGTVKTGLAILEKDGTLIRKQIISTQELERTTKEIIYTYPVDTFVIGNGTHHKEIKTQVQKWTEDIDRAVKIVIVNEKYTTEMGKRRFWKYNPPKGLNRFIPEGLRIIPVPIDDYVAWIIGGIYLGIVKEEDINHKKIERK